MALRPLRALFAAVIAAVIAAGLPLGAVPAAPGRALAVSDAWIRATPGSDVAAVYLTLRNTGTQPVVVSGVRSPRAGHAMIHESVVVDGQARMRVHEPLTVPPGATVRFAPEGLHIMLGMLAAPLAPGADVPLELLLEDGGTLAFSARVRAPGAP